MMDAGPAAAGPAFLFAGRNAPIEDCCCRPRAMEFSAEIAVLLFFVAMLAGIVDAIAGGGGLIVIPALLAAGLPPEAAIATNKIGGIGGSTAATLHFLRTRQIDLHRSRWMALGAFVGSLMGGIVLTQIDSSVLSRLIPVLLIGFALYFLLSPRVGAEDRKARIPVATYALVAAPLIGFYDGFFGPGTGTFLAISLVTLLGFNLVKATAHTKLLNLCSNIASVLFFSLNGNILWAFGLPLLAGQWIGGTIGARLVVSHGHRLIKIVMSVVAIAISAKMIWSA
ncbi:TSUP family transporter [Castellaniella sp. GW247-6E4]|uniref:TSUP family transporter n=1 Tax=Castellaniella sp. GW247-6E4 TaxID=3140380 RepID=UPI003315CF21